MMIRIFLTAGLLVAAASAFGQAPGPAAAPAGATITPPVATPPVATPPATTQAEDTPRSPEAIAAMQQRFREAFFRDYDSNSDGAVTRAEYDAVRDARFRGADRDQDNALSEVEYIAEYEGRLRAEYGTRPLDEAFHRSIRQASRRFESIDRDRDLSTSRAEHDVVANRTFVRADANGDGQVTATDPLPQPVQPRPQN